MADSDLSSPLLVVDFDGTVYRGDGPVSFYAGRIAEALPSGDRALFLADFERYLALGVAAAAAADDPIAADALRSAVDPWWAAWELAHRRFGVHADVMNDAFVATRVHMLGDSCALDVVETFTDVLAGLRGKVRIVLATNSPAEGLLPLLEKIGVTGLFDEVVPGAMKPAGLRTYLRSALGARLETEPWQLFSVGDHYFNEIEPAVEIGAHAGYIDRFGRADGPASAVAATVEGVIPAILAWADDPSSFPFPLTAS